MNVRLLVVRALTPWTSFVEDLQASARAEGRLLDIVQCHPNLHQVQEAMRLHDPQVVLWCRVAKPLVPHLKAWHQGRTFLMFNWDSPTLFGQRTHMVDVLKDMDHVFTTDREDDVMTYLLPPVKLAVDVSSPSPYPAFDIFIGVTTLYPGALEDGAIDRHELFRVLDKSPVAFGLYGPEDVLASHYPRSFRGYLPPQDFARVASRATLCLSLHPHSARGYLNERTCRILACGKPLVTDCTAGPTRLLDGIAFFLDSKAGPQGWLASIRHWLEPSTEMQAVRDTMAARGKAWIGERATWSHWWAAVEPALTPALPKALVLKPYCGLCNQLISVFQGIALAKASGRRLWIQGFQPAFNVYPDYGRKAIEDVFVVEELSRVFEWPISGVPGWVDTREWPSPQRASQAKFFKRPSFLSAPSVKDKPVVYGGFLFFKDFPCADERSLFLTSILSLVTRRVRETYEWVMATLGLTPGTYQVLHLRLEEDMVAHLAKRSKAKVGKVRDVLMGLYNEVVDKMDKHCKTFICVGTALVPATEAYLATIAQGFQGVTSKAQKQGIAVRLGKGRELAALIDFMIALGGTRFGGTSVSSFSEIIAEVYSQDAKIIFPREELWARLAACHEPKEVEPKETEPKEGEPKETAAHAPEVDSLPPGEAPHPEVPGARLPSPGET